MGGGVSPRQWLRLARWVTIGSALGAALYLGGKFDLVTLPEDGCSPIARYPSGSRLLVDRWASDWAAGDCAFASDQGGVVHIVLLARRSEVGRWWVETDAADCPGIDPEVMGWLSGDRLLGRVVLSLGR